MATPETRRQLLTAVAACDDKKGEDTRILELDTADSGLADFFLITSASNDRQVVAIADEIELRLKRDFGLYATSVEGRRQAEWILMDYVDFIVHVFSAEKRAFYGLERLRKSAVTISVETLSAELKALIAASRTRKAAPKPVAKKAVAKKLVAKTVKAATKKTVKKAANKTAAPAKKAAAKKSK